MFGKELSTSDFYPLHRVKRFNPRVRGTCLVSALARHPDFDGL